MNGSEMSALENSAIIADHQKELFVCEVCDKDKV